MNTTRASSGLASGCRQRKMDPIERLIPEKINYAGKDIGSGIDL